MSNNVTLSVPTIKVNNDVIAIVPNSFGYKAGDGEIKVRAASTGGGNATSVHSQDAETMFSTVKFKLYPTAENLQMARDWKARIGCNTVEAIQRGSSCGGGEFNVAFKNISVTNDPEINATADGDIEVEMAGDKLA